MTDTTLQPRPAAAIVRPLPSQGRSVGAQGFGDVAVIKEPGGARAEAIRALRTHIIAQHLDLGRRALVIVSPHASAGCSFVAANLAASLAQIGLNTLLIDADLRRPALAGYFPPRSSDHGLRQSLTPGGAEPLDYIEGDYFENLSVLQAGGVASNPLELLGDSRYPDLMNACLRAYDVTIIDTPPANVGADAVRISTVIGYSLIVARDKQSRIADVETLSKELSVDGVKVVGTVLCEG